MAVSMNGSKASGAKGKGESLSRATADAEAPCEQSGCMKQSAPGSAAESSAEQDMVTDLTA